MADEVQESAGQTQEAAATTTETTAETSTETQTAAVETTAETKAETVETKTEEKKEETTEEAVLSPDGYEVKMPEGMQEDPDLMPKLREMGVEMGLSKSEFSRMVDTYNQVMKTRMDAAKQQEADQLKRWEGDLRNEWKGKADDNFKAIDELVKTVGGDEAVKLGKETMVFKHPVVARMLQVFAEAISEDSLIVKEGRLRGKRETHMPDGTPKIII